MNKKVPERRCLICGAHKPKNELLRIVRLKDGSVVLDKTGKVSGRGAYICPNTNCYKKAKKIRRIESELGIDIPENIYEAIAAEISEKEDSEV